MEAQVFVGVSNIWDVVMEELEMGTEAYTQIPKDQLKQPKYTTKSSVAHAGWNQLGQKVYWATMKVVKEDRQIRGAEFDEKYMEQRKILNEAKKSKKRAPKKSPAMEVDMNAATELSSEQLIDMILSGNFNDDI